MSAPVRIVATFIVRREHLDEFIRLAHATLVVPTRAEPGCVQYDLCQDAADPTRLAMLEAWASPTALDAHLARASLRDAVARLAPMAAGPPAVARLLLVGDA